MSSFQQVIAKISPFHSKNNRNEHALEHNGSETFRQELEQNERKKRDEEASRNEIEERKRKAYENVSHIIILLGTSIIRDRDDRMSSRGIMDPYQNHKPVRYKIYKHSCILVFLLTVL